MTQISINGTEYEAALGERLIDVIICSSSAVAGRLIVEVNGKLDTLEWERLPDDVRPTRLSPQRRHLRSPWAFQLILLGGDCGSMNSITTDLPSGHESA
jgi:hypothetical protein